MATTMITRMITKLLSVCLVFRSSLALVDTVLQRSQRPLLSFDAFFTCTPQTRQTRCERARKNPRRTNGFIDSSPCQSVTAFLPLDSLCLRPQTSPDPALMSIPQRKGRLKRTIFLSVDDTDVPVSCGGVTMVDLPETEYHESFVKSCVL